MPILNPEEFKARYDRFDKTSSLRIGPILEEVELLHCPDPNVWGDKQVPAIMALTAHILEMELREAATSSAAATAVSRGQAPGFADASNGEWLGMTTHGKLFLSIRESLPNAVVGFAF